MDQNVKESLLAAVAGFQTGKSGLVAEETVLDAASSAFLKAMEAVFVQEEDFMAKLQKMDAWFDEHSDYDSIREFMFDLLLINFFTSDALRFEDDYLDSPEWQQIEDDTLDRGTELLNVFLYLRECIQEDIEPSLPDYLNEFLLVEDEEFQDEHEIYEDVIANQGLMDTGYQEISEVAGSISSTATLKEAFYPILSFFLNPAPEPEELNEYIEFSDNRPFESAVLFSIIVFYIGLENFSLKVSEK